MKSEKKNVIISFLSIGLVISSLINILLGIQHSVIKVSEPEKKEQILVIGVDVVLQSLDPVDAWDYNSQFIIDQIVERLWWYNLSNPDLQRIHVLAINETWISATQLRVFLRKGIKFHDGSAFNAEAVKWNLERLIYLYNHTGELSHPGISISATHSLFEFPNGAPIFDHFEVVDQYTIDIFLSKPYSPIMDLMCFISCGIISPTSHKEQAKSTIHQSTDGLIGTGPYLFEYYDIGERIVLQKWEDYWQEPPFIEKIVFNIIYDETTLNYAMLAGDIDYLINPMSSLFNKFNESSYSILYENQKPNLNYYYIKMNPYKLNKTWREAISYALNYSAIIEQVEIIEGHSVVKANNPMSSSFLGYDPTVVPPLFNITYARELLINIGFGDFSWTDSQWESANFLSVNYTYSKDRFGLDYYIGLIIVNNLKKIGVKVILDDQDYCIICDYSYTAYLRWLKDYLSGDLVFWHFESETIDPLNMLVQLFSNCSDYDYSELNDIWLEQKFEASLQELNETKRFKYYSEIQHYLGEVLFPHIFLFHQKIFNVHASDLSNVPYNVLNKLWVYPIKRYNYSLSQII